MGVVYVKDERACVWHTAEASSWTSVTFPLWHTTRSLEVLNTIWSSGFPQSDLSKQASLSGRLRLFALEQTPPLPSVSLLWLVSFPSCCPFSIKKENPQILLASYLDFGVSTKHTWKHTALTLLLPSPILVKSLPVSSFQSSKGMTGFLFSNHDTDLRKQELHIFNGVRKHTSAAAE